MTCDWNRPISGAGIIPNSQANELVWQRHEPPESETQKPTTHHSANSRCTVCFSSAYSLTRTGVNMERLAPQLRNSELGEFPSFWVGGKQTCPCPEGRHYVIPQRYSLSTQPWETAWTQNGQDHVLLAYQQECGLPRWLNDKRMYLPIQEMRVRSLGQEHPLEKEMATPSSILAWRIPWTEEPGGLQAIGSQRGGHNLETEHAWTYARTARVCKYALGCSGLPLPPGSLENGWPQDWSPESIRWTKELSCSLISSYISCYSNQNSMALA